MSEINKVQEIDNISFNDSMLIFSDEEENKNVVNVITESNKKLKKANNRKQNETRFEFLEDIMDQNMKRPTEEGYDPTTLYIPKKYFYKFTAFERQYWEIKRKYFDSIICFKKGKFYELYERDAEIAAKLFDMKVANRVNMKMAGFPIQNFDTWASRFIEAGYKVARVDQKETGLGKQMREKEQRVKSKVIERELVDVVTPGTVYNSDLILSPLQFYLAVIKRIDICPFSPTECIKEHHFSVLLYDASINKIKVTTFCDTFDYNVMGTIFVQNDIREIISEENIKFFDSKSISPIKEIEDVENIKDQIERMSYFSKKLKLGSEQECFRYLYYYFIKLKRDRILLNAEVLPLEENSTNMTLDGSTIKNMDILANNHDNTEECSLFKKINYCTSSFGQRKLKRWLLSPLTDIKLINERRERTKALTLHSNEVKEKFLQIGDVERLICKLTNMPRTVDLKKLLDALKHSLDLLKILVNIDHSFFKNEYFGIRLTEILCSFESLYKVEEEVTAISEDDPIHILNKKFKTIQNSLNKYLRRINEFYGLKGVYKSLNKDLFQIEVDTNCQVPEDFRMVSFTKNVKRYYTDELKRLVRTYSETEEKIFQAENSLLKRSLEFLLKDSMFFNELIDFLSTVDCYLSFNLFNNQKEFNEPEFTLDDQTITLKGLVHPTYLDFIPNDFSSTPNYNINLVTGPNMGGKSTFLRAICLNIILAQMGLNVSCMEMKLPIFDKIFTRIGASDSLAKGESTFYIELSECSKILNTATSRSFVLLDELGRGTSTRDGEAIAKAVLDHLNKIGCVTFFSTHYHNLVQDYKNAEKFYVKAQIDKNDIIFLYKIDKGICYESYGLYVARLANIPESIINRANEIKKQLEK